VRVAAAASSLSAAEHVKANMLRLLVYAAGQQRCPVPVVPAVTSVSGDDQASAQKDVLRPHSANGCTGRAGAGACA
jgi:hypothetical protein